MIELKNVSKWYGSFQVLTDCTTNVAKGDVVVVEGPTYLGAIQAFRSFEAEVVAAEVKPRVLQDAGVAGAEHDRSEGRRRLLSRAFRLSSRCPSRRRGWRARSRARSRHCCRRSPAARRYGAGASISKYRCSPRMAIR